MEFSEEKWTFVKVEEGKVDFFATREQHAASRQIASAAHDSMSPPWRRRRPVWCRRLTVTVNNEQRARSGRAGPKFVPI